MQDYIKNFENKMEKSFTILLKNFSKLKSGRANMSILDDIEIDYYETKTPIKQLCNVSIPEPNLIVLSPWDNSIISNIEKVILSANLGITPQNDGKIVRLPIPTLTEEGRKNIVKKAKKLSEDAKISIRNVRREANETIKKLKKNSEISEDEEKNILKKIQDISDNYINKIDSASNNKQKEIMSI